MNPPGEDVSDADLVRRALEGEDRAFTLLMRRYSGPLFIFVRRYVGAPDVAQDLLQESFVAAWSALNRYDASRPLGAWLRAIALNKCRDHSRRLSLRRVLLGGAESAEARRQADPAPGGIEVLLANERQTALEAAIAALPAKLKEPLLLTYFEGLSQQEAAVALGTTAKAIETRVYRARRRLGEALAEPPD